MLCLKTFFIIVTVFVATNLANRRGPKNPKDFRPPGIAFSIIRPNRRGSFHGTNEVNCFSDCYSDKITDTLNGNTLLVEFGQPWFEENQFETEKLQDFCGKVGGFHDCLKSCPDTDFKTALVKTFAPFDFACNQSNYIQTAPCYKKIFHGTKQLCHGGDKCESNLNELKDQYEDVFVEDSNNVTAYLSSQCDYYNCYLSCVSQPMTSQCAEDGFKNFKQMAQMKINAVKGMFASTTEDYNEPEQCTRFRNADD